MKTFSSILPFANRLGTRGITCISNGSEYGGGGGEAESAKIVWIVRAGKGGENAQFALDNNCVAINWPEMGDLLQYADTVAIKSALQTVQGESNPNRIGSHAGQLWNFSREIKTGQLVILPLKSPMGVAVGKITGGYEFHSECERGAKHQHKVEWLHRNVARSEFDTDIRYSLGALGTVSRVKRSRAMERILRMLNRLAGQGDETSVPSLPEEENVPREAVDPEVDARTRIYDFIGQNFIGHGMADLVEEILCALEFQCVKSPPGPDGSVDILAVPGNMGFGSPRLCVQVKSGRDRVGTDVLTQLTGAMQRVNAEKGLLVSWSGFKLSNSERRHHYFSVRLWEADDLVELIERHYDKFSDNFKKRMPLKKIWVLNADD